MTLANRRILVTGGAGFMGSGFIRHLLTEEDFQGCLVNLDALTYASNLTLLDTISADPRYHFVQGDIRDSALLLRLHQTYHFDQIVHFAAETHVDRSIKEPRLFFETNVMGTLELLELVRLHPSIRFHLISTDEVYGQLGLEGSFNENSPYQPNSPYSASKAASDYLVRSYVKTYGIFGTLSHACNNYGPGQYPEKLIPLMLANALSNRPLPVYGKGDQIREWLYVDDHARAVCALLKSGVSGEVYNISGGEERTNLSLIHLLLNRLANKLGKSEKEYQKLIKFVEDRPGHDFRYAIDPSKMRALGWEPRISFDKGLDATINWYLQSQFIKILCP